ncbi:MAG: CDP-alcohol phosphatidyltransferase family protein [Proteobacteria bacterium]|jgi:phosphatidylglycerophosphate synthase|nr:CDP-alcohol phosphatidyltransferase family protein [Pseudomonadota bacterium]MDA1292099.1 CDP-alcohol phosphatidyltransferase family protein [Pseudomonadota bacterium]
MANLLTAIRLLLVIPVAMAIANASLFASWVLLALIAIAIASDYFDGKVARAFKTASARGMLFDHGTDFVFVSTALFALSTVGLSSVLLPLLIVVAFSQYVLDSYFLFKQKQLRMSFLGRWNGIFYFIPIVLVAASRLPAFEQVQDNFNLIIVYSNYALTVSTLASIVDRAIAPMLQKEV